MALIVASANNNVVFPALSRSITRAFSNKVTQSNVTNQDVYAFITSLATNQSSGGLTIAEHNQLMALPTTVATPTNVSDAQTAIIAAIPTDDITAVRSVTDGLSATLAALPANIWSYSTRTLSGFGTLIADIWSHTSRTLTSSVSFNVSDIWNYATRTLTTAPGLTTAEHDQLFAIPTNPALPADVTSAREIILAALPEAPDNITIEAIETLVNAVKAKTDNLPANPASQTNLDVPVSTRLASGDYEVPDNAGIVEIKTRLPLDPASQQVLLDRLSEIEQLLATLSVNVDAQEIAQAVKDVQNTGTVEPGSLGQQIKEISSRVIGSL